jgi:hypothetical protein
MTAEAIQEMLDHEPFEAFRLCLSNGESYEVRNPHAAALMKHKLFIALDAERWTFVSYLHIAAIESLSNGHGRRRRRR